MEKRQKFCLKNSKRKLALSTINSALNNTCVYSIQDRFWLKKYILQLKLSNSDIKLTVKNIITTLAMQYTVSS